MKILTSIISMLFLGSLHLFAQTEKHGVKFGIQAGYCLADMRSSGETGQLWPVEYKFKSSYSVNAYLLLKTKKRLGLSLEPGVIRKGSNSTFENTGYNLNTDWGYNLDYFTIPVLLNLSLSRKLTIGAGATADYLLKAGYKDEKGPDSDVTTLYEDMEYSFLAGIDYSAFKFVDFFLRYSYSISPAYDQEISENFGMVTGNLKLYNQVFQVGLRFNLKPLKDI